MSAGSRGARRFGGIRARTYAVVLVVVLAPLALVAVADRSGAKETIRMQALADRAAAAAAAEIGGGADAADAAERAAASDGVRVRVIGAGGVVIAEADHEAATSLRDRTGDALFGPDGAPSLRAHDAARPDGVPWPEIEGARRDGRSSGCAIGLSGTLVVCHAAVGVSSGGEERVVLAQKSSPRAIRALFDLRYPLLKLTLYVLFVGALLAAWLGRRVVGPVLRLRREVLARAGGVAGSGRAVYKRADGPRGVAGSGRDAYERTDGPSGVAGSGSAGAAPIPRVSDDEVGDLADAFNALLAALEAKSRANEAFAADLAHELKSPIAALRACAGGIAGPLDAARAERVARVLADSTARLDVVVTRFLELARAEAGLPGEERSVIDVAALVHGLCTSLSDEGRYPGVRFEVAGDRAEVEAAAGPLEEALRNIVENAASFAGEGGWVRARVVKDGDGVTIEIADSGPGIAPDRLPRVFDRFFTDRRDSRGTGLGLAYAKAVVEAHEGSIAAASPEGGGAVLTVRLPPSPRPGRAPPPPPGSPTGA